MSDNARHPDPLAFNPEENGVPDIPADKDVLIAQLYADLRESRRRYALAVDAWQALQEERQQLRAQIDKMTINYTGMKGREKRWNAEKKLLESRLRNVEASLKKMTANFLGMKGREQQWLAREDAAKNTISFRLGASILNAGKSWRGFFALPGELLRIRKDARKRRAARRQQTKVSQTPAAPSRSWDFRKPARDRLRVAAIMDEFTCRCYAPECELLELLPDTWHQQMEDFRPDVLFVESAWQGKDDAWKQKISTFSETIRQLLDWCRGAGIPSLLWNKEDPPHYSTFLPLARAVDVVFTTDIDCIPLYKRDLGHDHVYLLPFAAQPAMHNPVEKYDRQHKFCFAGSYYLRYPERQRDFAMLMDALEKHAGIDIYDRNFDNPHPHYAFPDIYLPYILGKLPYNEIDRAYKGYTFGINMNTGKQSQSMFARRVYEMAASNTVVVSNFSRGMRNFFGDLVISGDDSREIERRLRPLLDDRNRYRKLRLRALRHVLAQHTYRRRLEYVRKKIWNQAPAPEPLVCLVASAANATEAALLREHFRRQDYARKELWLVNLDDPAPETSPDIHVVSDLAACREALATAGADFLGLLRPEHWYGPSYLTDLILTKEYSTADVFGKAAHYAATDGSVDLREDGGQYRNTESLPIWASLCRTSSGDLFWNALEAGQGELVGSCFAIDEFNFIEQGAGLAPSLREVAEDLVLGDTGIDFAGRVLPLSERLTLDTPPQIYPDTDTKVLSVHALAEMFRSSGSLRFTDAGSALQIVSTLPAGKYAYSHGPAIEREKLNLLLNSAVTSAVTGSLDLRISFTFLDAEQQKLSHSIVHPGKAILAIPQECRFVKLSLRVEGPGRAMLKPLRFGKVPVSPAALLCRTSTLVLAKQYPAYDDLYKYGFLHSRLAAYRKAGRIVDMFRIQQANTFYREFEGIDVATGDAMLLDATLASGQISHVCVHLVDKAMWTILKKYLDTLRVTIWIHGAEIQHWKQREFEFARMSAEEIEKQKKRSLNALQLWKEILSLEHKNVNFVFVSDSLRREAEHDLETNFAADSYTVIHNFIDNDVFPYQKKKPEERFRVFSIRPYTTQKYANDLSVAAIKELSRRPDFERYTFTLVGDGPLFEETVAPIAHLPNVHLEQRFLTHAEMQEQFKRHGIFLNPTRWDSQGVSRDEAMAAGLVPVTNAVSAIPEFVDETCACLAPAEDSTALADSIERLANAPDLFLAMSQRAAAQVRRLSGFEQTIGRELQLLESSTPLCGGGKPLQAGL
ncbi:glycosyltransferase [uncultured Desulfovibrio sp.]|uniref:glycosyltransferase family protein n=1 Tax=uncultured Desulfovibrio sp. TaxID=167968 RepID=UPI0025891AF5|nr:glycosyltransferase [uncultured Desulfovibrio sp.]